MSATSYAPIWKRLLAFGVIYLVWGSTFLAIRVGVHEVPPLLFAAARFLTAGVLVFGWAMARGERWPSGREWGAIFGVATLIFVVNYGLLFWAERRVASGTAAVMLATIPGLTALAEILLLRTGRVTGRLVGALGIGFGGVAVLLSHSVGAGAIDRLGALALLVAAVSWSTASALSRRLPLPASRGVSAGAQMLAGGSMLAVLSPAFGEMRGFHVAAVSGRAWGALAYLIVAGSMLGFTVYVWLLQHESPTRVGTYAYVNPAVAVLLGVWVGDQVLNGRMVVGMVLILVSVVLITTGRAGKAMGLTTRTVAADAE